MIAIDRLCALAGFSAVLLAMSVDLASAGPARVYSNTNLRQGPGTNYAVISTVPGGSIVESANVRRSGARRIGMAGSGT
jgi:uncharacterized protein YraI